MYVTYQQPRQAAAARQHQFLGVVAGSRTSQQE
jgi:hypothetical protein